MVIHNKKCADKQQDVAFSTTSQKEATIRPEAVNDIKRCTLGDIKVLDVYPTSILSFFIFTNDTQLSFNISKNFYQNEQRTN